MLKLIVPYDKGNKSLFFHNKFSKINVRMFCGFMSKQDEIDELERKGGELLEKLDKLNELEKNTEDKTNRTDEFIFILDEFDSIDSKVRSLKIEQLGLLSKTPEETVDFLLNTKGVTNNSIVTIWKRIDRSLGDFFAFFKSVKPRNKFRFSDYQRSSFWSLTKIKTFQVFDMKGTTVLRSQAAKMASSKIGEMKEEFQANNWTSFPRFLAYVCRPESEEVEISASKKKKKAFLSGRINKTKVVDMKVADRLEAYNEKLKETVEIREKIFEELPLPLALGAYKSYFFLSPS